MNFLKKSITTGISLLFACITTVAAQSSYFTGTGGSDKKVLIYDSVLLNGKSDKSDLWITITVKNDIINDLNNYSNIQVIDASQTETIKKIQKAYEGSEYSGENPVELGKSLQAKYYITLSTTRDKDTYSLSAIIYNVETRKSEGSYSSAYLPQSEFISKVHGQTSVKLLESLGVNLTSAGKRLIQQGNLTDSNSSSVIESQENLNAISAELERISKEESKLNSSRITDLELEAEKTRIETQKAVLIRQQEAEKERLLRLQEDAKRQQEEEVAKMDRDSKRQMEILNLSNEVERKAMEIRNKKLDGLTASQYIELIEAEKQTLYQNKKSISDATAEYKKNLKAEYDAKIEERKNRPLGKAELTADGKRSTLSQAQLDSDISILREEYENKVIEYSADLEQSIVDVQNSLSKKISADISKMESLNFKADSLYDNELYFRVNNYDGNKGGWYYTLAFAFGGKTIYTTQGILSYKEISGKDVPSEPKKGEKLSKQQNERIQEYYDNVESYDSFFRMNVPYIEAILSYRITAEKYPKASEYQIRIMSLEFKNVSTAKTIKNENFLYEKVNYSYTPACKVDWRTKSEQEKDIKREAKKKFEEEQRQSKTGERVKKEKPESVTESASFSDGKTTLVSFPQEFLPGSVSVYMNKEEYYVAFGYSLTLGFTENIFGGINFDFGAGGPKSTWNSPSYSSDTYDDGGNEKELEFFYDVTGMLGISFNPLKHVRLSTWGEAGWLFDGPVFGAGAAIEFYAPKGSGVFFSGTYLITDETNLYKLSIGYEICF